MSDSPHVRAYEALHYLIQMPSHKTEVIVHYGVEKRFKARLTACLLSLKGARAKQPDIVEIEDMCA